MRLDTHIHSERSLDGINRPREILEHVRQFTRLDAVAFTDHNVPFPRKEAEALTREYGILVIPGMELGDISSGKHIVVLNLDDDDARALLKLKNPYDVIRFIACQGGLSIAAHPLRRGYRNFSEMGFDAVETFNGGCARHSKPVRNPRKMPEIGCSDAHLKGHIGGAWTEVQGVDLERFNDWTAPGLIRRVTESVIENLRRGLCCAGGGTASDAQYLSYGWLVSKKYVGKSLTALRSLVP